MKSKLNQLWMAMALVNATFAIGISVIMGVSMNANAAVNTGVYAEDSTENSAETNDGEVLARVCYQDQSKNRILSVESFDYWEAPYLLAHAGRLDLGDPQVRLDQKLDRVLERLFPYAPEIAEDLSVAGRSLLKNLPQYLTNLSAEPSLPNDSQVEVAQPCFKERIAIKRASAGPLEKSLLISDRLFSSEAMNADHRLGVVLNLLLSEYVSQAKNVRYLNYLISSNRFSTVTEENAYLFQDILDRFGVQFKRLVPIFVPNLSKHLHFFKGSLEVHTDRNRVSVIRGGRLSQSIQIKTQTLEVTIPEKTRVYLSASHNFTRTDALVNGRILFNGNWIEIRADDEAGESNSVNFLEVTESFQPRYFIPLRSVSVKLYDQNIICPAQQPLQIHPGTVFPEHCQPEGPIRINGAQYENVRSLSLSAEGKMKRVTLWHREPHGLRVKLAGCDSELEFREVELDEEGHALKGYFWKDEEVTHRGVTHHFGFPASNFRDCKGFYYLAHELRIPSYQGKRVLSPGAVGTESFRPHANQVCQSYGYEKWASYGEHEAFIQSEELYDFQKNKTVLVENRFVKLMNLSCSETLVKDYSK